MEQVDKSKINDMTRLIEAVNGINRKTPWWYSGRCCLAAGAWLFFAAAACGVMLGVVPINYTSGVFVTLAFLMGMVMGAVSFEAKR